MSQQLTVLQSLTSALPYIPSKRNENHYRRVTSAAESTRDTDCPAGWRSESPRVLLGFVQSALPSRGTALNPNDRFLKFAPFDDECSFLSSEGDIFAATISHLVNPVNIAVMRSLPGGSLTMSCEHSSGTSRTDIRWTFHMSTNQQHVTVPRTIAILELKAKDVLHFRDFELAMATDDKGERKKQRDSQNGDLTPNPGTFFQANAFWLMKQATKYAEQLQVMDVAIFDWSNMFILDYSTWNPSNRHPTLVRGIWMDENSRTNHEHQSLYTFRAVLYGFILRALHRHGFIR